MSMLLINGVFRIVGAAPDGDSVRFYPSDPSDWDRVEGLHRVRRNAAGGAQLRLDGIDALETHYGTAGGSVHQPLAYARRAAAELVSWLGFRGVRRDENETVTEAHPAEVPGYVFTRGADLYGRCVALAGRGEPSGASGTRVHVTPAMLRRTINYRQLRRGMAYPTYYRKLFVELRQTMTTAVAQARPAGGLWPADRTRAGAVLPEGMASLANTVLLPKLFRRLVDYYALNDFDPALDGFKDYLAQRNDRIFVLSNGQWTGFDTVVRVTGQTVRLTRPPEDLVFEER